MATFPTTNLIASIPVPYYYEDPKEATGAGRASGNIPLAVGSVFSPYLSRRQKETRRPVTARRTISKD